MLRDNHLRMLDGARSDAHFRSEKDYDTVKKGIKIEVRGNKSCRNCPALEKP